MALTQSEIDFAHELYASLGDITSRKMMGGLSIYCDGVIFAILDSDSVAYLKAKGAFAEKLAANGARQFCFGDKNKTMCYWTLPDPALEDPDIASDWARQALDAL